MSRKQKRAGTGRLFLETLCGSSPASFVVYVRLSAKQPTPLQRCVADKLYKDLPHQGLLDDMHASMPVVVARGMVSVEVQARVKGLDTLSKSGKSTVLRPRVQTWASGFWNIVIFWAVLLGDSELDGNGAVSNMERWTTVACGLPSLDTGDLASTPRENRCCEAAAAAAATAAPAARSGCWLGDAGASVGDRSEFPDREERPADPLSDGGGRPIWGSRETSLQLE
jgi:hypothetical protein